MKKQIPYLVALLWMVAVAVLAFLDGLNWSTQRKMSSYLDGCIEGDQIYLVENIEGEGILYVMDSKGNVKEVSLASSVKSDSLFVKIDYREGLYALLREKGNPNTYYIAEYDNQGNYISCTPAFIIAEEGEVTGLWVDAKGYYLTTVQENKESAAAYFLERKELEDTKESQEATSTRRRKRYGVLCGIREITVGFLVSKSVCKTAYQSAPQRDIFLCGTFACWLCCACLFLNNPAK